jgi:hypothetical protein
VPALQPLSKTREDQRKRRKIDDPLRALVDLSWFLYTWNRSDQFNQAPPSIQKIDVVVVLHIMPENQRKPAKTSENQRKMGKLVDSLSIYLDIKMAGIAVLSLPRSNYQFEKSTGWWCCIS